MLRRAVCSEARNEVECREAGAALFSLGPIDGTPLCSEPHYEP